MTETGSYESDADTLEDEEMSIEIDIRVNPSRTQRETMATASLPMKIISVSETAADSQQIYPATQLSQSQSQFTQLGDLSQLLPPVAVKRRNLSSTASQGIVNRRANSNASLSNPYGNPSQQLAPSRALSTSLKTALCRLPQFVHSPACLNRLSITDYRALLKFASTPLSGKETKTELRDILFPLVMGGCYETELVKLRAESKEGGVLTQSSATASTTASQPRAPPPTNFLLPPPAGLVPVPVPVQRNACVISDRDGWEMVDHEVASALGTGGSELGLGHEGMSDISRLTETCGSGFSNSSSYSAGGSCFGIRENWQPASSKHEESLLEFDVPTYKHAALLSSQQEYRLRDLLRMNAESTSASASAAAAAVTSSSSNSDAASSAAGVAANCCLDIDYVQRLQDYILQYISPKVAELSEAAAGVSQQWKGPFSFTDGARADSDIVEECASPSAADAILVPCENVEVQTDPVVPHGHSMSASAAGSLGAIDPARLPARVVKLCRFDQPKLGLVLAAIACNATRGMKTVVKAKVDHLDADVARHLNIGDELVSISGHDVERLDYRQHVTAISQSARPIVLGFCHSPCWQHDKDAGQRE